MRLPVDEPRTLQDARCHSSPAEMAVLLLRSEIPANVTITALFPFYVLADIAVLEGLNIDL